MKEFIWNHQLRELVPQWVDMARKEGIKNDDISRAIDFIDSKLNRANVEVGSVSVGQYQTAKHEFLRLFGKSQKQIFIIVDKKGHAFQRFTDWGFGSKVAIWENTDGKHASPPARFNSVGAAREFITANKTRFVGATVTKFKGAFIYV